MQRCDVMQLANMDAAEQFSLWTARELDLPSVPPYELDATAGLVALFADSTRPAPISHLQIPAASLATGRCMCGTILCITSEKR